MREGRPSSRRSMGHDTVPVIPKYRADAAFGLVEVVVGMLLMTIIISGAVLTMVGSGSALRSADVHRMRAEVARAAVQHLSEHQAWGRLDGDPCVRRYDNGSPPRVRSRWNVSCLVADQPFVRQQIDGRTVEFEVRATARLIDSEVDGTEEDDKDGRVPDWFELHIEVTGGAAGSKPYVLDASTDSATRGTGGVLVVRTCLLDAQVDDRVELGECREPGTLPLAAPSGAGASVDRDLVAFAVAPSWAKEISVRPTSTTCSVTRLQPNGQTGQAMPLTTDGRGEWTSPTALNPGTYQVSCQTPTPAGDAADYEPWPARTRPVDGKLKIEEGRTSTAFFAFQPKAVPVKINQGTIHYWRFKICTPMSCTPVQTRAEWAAEFHQYQPGAHPPHVVGVQPVPSPYGRLRLPPAAYGSKGVTVQLRPGLYGNTVLAGANQYYLYTGTRNNTSLGVEFGAPINWFYVKGDGSVVTGPADTGNSGLWIVKWFCRDRDTPIQLPCAEGPVPQGRGGLALGGAQGRGGT